MADVGIGQGRRAAVQLFGVLLRGLIEGVHLATIGIGTAVPQDANEAVDFYGSASCR